MQIDTLKLEEWYRQYHNPSYINISENSSEIQTLHQILQKCGYDLSSLQNSAIDYAIGKIEEDCKILLSDLYHVNPENVLICNGASEALFIAILHTIRTNSDMIIENPFYKKIDKLIRAFNSEIIQWDLIKNNSILIDIPMLNAIINKKTRSVLINHPHNPTGKSITNDQLMEIIEIATRYNANIISDEVTLPLLSGKTKISPCFANLYDKAISISSLSKSFWSSRSQICWIVAEKRIIKKCQN